MELLKQTQSVEKSEGDIQAFQIGDEAFLIELARNKLYKNPLRIFPQEYLANARDAHVEAGCAHLSVEVKLPTVLDSTFIVRDFGLGMSPEVIKEVFTQYGVSTKRNSDKLTGGFGIGSKSAWSYTDSFGITTITGGVKYEYQAFLDETKKGALMKLDESPTTEPAGTAIEILVNRGDIGIFKNYIEEITEHWTVQPHITNSEESSYSSKKTDLNGKKWSLGNPQRRILIDEIPYEIDTSLLKKGMTYYDDIGEEQRVHLDNLQISYLERYLISVTNKELKASPNRSEIDHQSVETYRTLIKIIDECRNEQETIIVKKLEGKNFLQQVGIALKPQYVFFNYFFPRDIQEAAEEFREVTIYHLPDDLSEVTHFTYAREDDCYHKEIFLQKPEFKDKTIAVGFSYLGADTLAKVRRVLVKYFKGIKRLTNSQGRSTSSIKYNAKVRWAQVVDHQFRRVEEPESLEGIYYLAHSDRHFRNIGAFTGVRDSLKYDKRRDNIYFIPEKDLANLPEEFVENNEYQKVLLEEAKSKHAKLVNSASIYDKKWLDAAELIGEGKAYQLTLEIRRIQKEGLASVDSVTSRFLPLSTVEEHIEIVDLYSMSEEVAKLIKKEHPVTDQFSNYGELSNREKQLLRDSLELNELRRIHENSALHRYSSTHSRRQFRKGPGRRK